jgi:mannosyltransferase OCH1-like enzyme
MIPKIIHYCWISSDPYPEKIQKCIDSWKKYLPDYEFKKWDTNTFDMNSVPYVAQAYKQKKWSFIADYIRVWALKNYGGIYLDSDVEVLKSFDDLLNQRAFCCFEHHATEEYPIIEAAVIASEKDGRWINKVFEYFDGKDFKDKNGITDVTPIPYPMALKTKEIFDVKFDNTTQVFDDLTVYSRDYFSPKSNHTYEIYTTANTYAIHHFSGSWFPKCSQIISPYIKKYGFWGKVLCCIIHPVAVMQHLKYKRTHKSNVPQ